MEHTAANLFSQNTSLDTIPLFQLHRLLEADEHAAMAEYEEADERERMRGKEKEEEGEDGGAEGGSRDEVEWQAASTTVDVEPSETGERPGLL